MQTIQHPDAKASEFDIKEIQAFQTRDGVFFLNESTGQFEPGITYYRFNKVSHIFERSDDPQDAYVAEDAKVLGPVNSAMALLAIGKSGEWVLGLPMPRSNSPGMLEAYHIKEIITSKGVYTYDQAKEDYVYHSHSDLAQEAKAARDEYWKQVDEKQYQRRKESYQLVTDRLRATWPRITGGGGGGGSPRVRRPKPAISETAAKIGARPNAPPGRGDGNVFDARSFNWTPGVTAGTNEAQFAPPPDLPAGTYTVTVSAAGISSVPDPNNPVTIAANPVYANTAWAGQSGTVLADPVTGVMGTIGVNCFADMTNAVSAAETAAAQSGIRASVVVNGDGAGGNGDYGMVTLDSPVTLYMQLGSVTFDWLSGGSGSAKIHIAGVHFEIGGGSGYNDTTYQGSITGSGSLDLNVYGGLTLGGLDDVGGGTTIDGGTLTVTGMIACAGGVTVNSGSGFTTTLLPSSKTPSNTRPSP